MSPPTTDDDPLIRPLTRRRAADCALGIMLLSCLTLGLSPEASTQDATNFWERIYDPSRVDYVSAYKAAAAAFEQSDFEAMEVALDDLRAVSPSSRGTLYMEGLYRATTQHGHAEAILFYTRALAASDDRLVSLSPLHADMAVSLTHTGQYGEALASYEQAMGELTVPSNKSVFLSNMGDLRVALGRLEEAERSYREALRENPRYVHALLGLGVALERKGLHEEARGYLLAAILEDPRMRRVFGSRAFFAPVEERRLVKALIHEEVGEVEQAIASLEGYLEALEARGLAEDSLDVTTARRALERLRDAGPMIVFKGPAPLPSATGISADPTGGGLAIGDAMGRVARFKAGASPKLELLTTSGPEVVDLAYDNLGGLSVLYADGFVRRYDKAGKRREAIGPYAATSSSQPEALSPDGQLVVLSNRRRRLLSTTRRDTPQLTLSHIQTRGGHPEQIAVAPPRSPHAEALLAIWSRSTGLKLLAPPAAQVLQPPDAGQYGALAFSQDGKSVILGGSKGLLVVRVSDLKILKVFRMEGERPLAIAVDAAGAGGVGPALWVLTRGEIRAIGLSKLEAFTPR